MVSSDDVRAGGRERGGVVGAECARGRDDVGRRRGRRGRRAGGRRGGRRRGRRQQHGRAARAGAAAGRGRADGPRRGAAAREVHRAPLLREELRQHRRPVLHLGDVARVVRERLHEVRPREHDARRDVREACLCARGIEMSGQVDSQ